MNQSEVIQILDKIQTEFNIKSLEYKDKNVWPILRYYFALVLMKQTTKDEIKEPVIKNDKDDSEKQIETRKFSKLKNSFSLFSLPILKLKAIRENKSFSKVDAKIIFISPEFEPYPDIIDKKKYSRYLDPYIETLSKKQKTVKVQLTKNKLESNQYYIPVFEVDESILLTKIEIEQKIKNIVGKNNNSKKFNILLKSLNNYASSNKIDYVFNSWLIDELDQINRFEKMFYNLLKESKIKAVFFECYYSTCVFGLISACKQLKIKTIDIQHGIVDINYLGWNNMSNKVSHYLPEYYWTWCIGDKLEVESQNKTEFIKAFLGGNMWLKKFKDSEALKNNEANDSEEIGNYDKRILVSLQYNIFLDYIIDFIVPAIELCKKDYLWMFRFHPLNTNEDRVKIINILKKYKNVDYENATNNNLYTIFRISDVHIVASSAVAKEGLQFNLPTIIIHNQGADLFKELISNSVFAYANSPEVLLIQIETFKPSKNFNDDFIIETSEQYAFDFLDNEVNNYLTAV